MKTTDVASIIDEIRALKKKLSDNGVVANTIKVNPALLTPENIDGFLAESERLGLTVILDPSPR